MTKYDGIHKPEKIKTAPSDNVKNIEPEKKHTYFKNLFIRFIIAAVVLGSIFGISRANLPFSYAFTNIIQRAITMDFSPGVSVGTRDEFLLDELLNINNDNSDYDAG